MNTQIIAKKQRAPAINSPQMRGMRLKRIRNLANLSREQMCEDGEINRHTLVGWENGRFGGLTTKGAERIVIKVRNEGVHCTAEWLMEGEGTEPSVNPIPFMPHNESSDLNEDLTIAYELAVFKAKNTNAVDLMVDDDGMTPQYHEGDIVAGKKRTGKDIEKTIGHDCIVATEAGDVLLRNVRAGERRHTYTLICNNPAIKKRNSVIANVKLTYSAPVIWLRKKDISD